MQKNMLEEYYYVIKQQARECSSYPVAVRFTGRTVSEFKTEVFACEPSLHSVPNITHRDLELIYNDRWNQHILGEDDEMEYCITTPENPLIVFLPTELSMNEYKNYMTVALQSIDMYKRKQ